MPTLAFEGSVFLSTEVGRRELVTIAPSYTVDVLVNRAQSSILDGEQHEINFSDIPGNKVTNLLLSLSSGAVDVVITDDDSDTVSFSLTPSGMIILMNTLVTGLTITATADSVYDMIAGAANA
jgi:hypothetical protein